MKPNALHAAVKRKEVETLQVLVDMHLNVNERDGNQQTPLQLACSQVIYGF